jgi:hypothetical protein
MMAAKSPVPGSSCVPVPAVESASSAPFVTELEVLVATLVTGLALPDPVAGRPGKGALTIAAALAETVAEDGTPPSMQSDSQFPNAKFQRLM